MGVKLGCYMCGQRAGAYKLQPLNSTGWAYGLCAECYGRVMRLLKEFGGRSLVVEKVA